MRISSLLAISMKFGLVLSAFVALKQLEDPNMATEVERNWKEMFTGESMFDRREASVRILKRVTQKTLWTFFCENYLFSDRQKSIVIQVDAPSIQTSTGPASSDPYTVIIRHVESNNDLNAEELRYADEVDVPAAVATCHYDSRLAESFLNNFHVDPQFDFLPRSESIFTISDVKIFRSGLQFEDGRSLY